MPNNILRIVIPTNVGALLKLATLIFKKHQADGAASPLNALADYKWSDLGPNIALALAKHDEAEELSRRAEQAYRDRDKLMGDIPGLVRSSRDLLKGVYKKTPKKLGEWGFEVNDTPRASKPVAPKGTE